LLEFPTPAGPNYAALLLNTQGTNTPIDRYTLTVEFQDAEGDQVAASRRLIVDYGVKVENMTTYKARSSIFGALGGEDMQGPCDDSRVDQYYTTFEVTEGPVGALGWYLYNGPFDRTNRDNVNIVSEASLTNSDVSYNNIAWNCTSCNYAYLSGTAVGFLVDGGLNSGFGSDTTGGGINVTGLNDENLTILSGANSNLPYPFTGGRMITSLGSGGSEQACVDLWIKNCRYLRTPDTSTPPPSSSGIYPQGGRIILENAVIVTTVPIPQSVVDSFRWSVLL